MGQMSMGEALREYLNRSRIKSEVQVLELAEAWEQIMGKTVSKYTSQLQIVQKTLFITTEVGPLKQELNYQKARIIERVNELMGAGTIENIIIR